VFIAPRVFHATEAYVTGRTVDVHAPITGTLDAVAVQEGKTVTEGQLLFSIRRSFIDPQSQRWVEETKDIYAPIAGTVGGLTTVRGTFVQVDQKLCTIVDHNAQNLVITARIAVSPSAIHYIRDGARASVQADFLFGGKATDALVQSVDPLYDPHSQTIGVRIVPLQFPDGAEDLPLNMPVSVDVIRDRSDDDNPVIALFRTIFPETSSHDSP
jgi:multidrug resistance efflux pump